MMKLGISNIFKLVLLANSLAVFAHQPIVVKEEKIIVQDSEISKAYYGQLKGQKHSYYILAENPFELYVNILVPDIKDQKKDVWAVITKNNEEKLAVLSGPWKIFHEPFGYDNYWMGAKYQALASAGVYTINVFSSNNESKYVLAVGEKERFGFKESWKALQIIPKIKRDFFEESPSSFILSPIGGIYVLVMFLAAFLVGFVYRALLRKFSKRVTCKVSKNIGIRGRVLRISIAILLFVWAITTNWSPFLLFFSGFTFFEGFFSWCGLYAALGKVEKG